MFAKVSISNMKKSIRDYAIYFITIALCVSLFYAFCSLSSPKCNLITEGDLNFDVLKVILKYSTYAITGLLIFLVAYVNKYMIKRRMKEFAIYALLGTEQKDIARLFFLETLAIGIIAVIVGIIGGTLFCQTLKTIIMMSAEQKVSFDLTLYLDTVLITIGFFMAMFCVIGFFNARTLRKIKLIDMLKAESKGEYQFKKNKYFYITSLIIAIIGYAVAIYYSYITINLEPAIRASQSSLKYIAITIISFIIATYGLFNSLAYVIVMIKNRSISMRYKGLNLPFIGAIAARIKSAPVLMATISLTFLGSALSFAITLLMAKWSLGYLNYRVPFDVAIRNYSEYVADAEYITPVDYSNVINHLKEQGVTLKDVCTVEKYFINDKDMNSKEHTLAISLSDFNNMRRILGYSEITLGENQYTVQFSNVISEDMIKKYKDDSSVLSVGGTTMEMSENLYYTESLGEGIYSSNDYIYILPDKVCNNLKVAATNFYCNISDKMDYNKANDFERNYIYNWFEENYKELVSNIKNNSKSKHPIKNVIQVRIKSLEKSEVLNATLSMRILGIYLGIVMLMISLTILSLKELEDSLEHKKDYMVLRKLGVNEGKINNLIIKQISVYFIIPVIIALIGFIMFILGYSTMFEEQIRVYIGHMDFIYNIIISSAIMAAIYLVYFIATYLTFKRNVKV